MKTSRLKDALLTFAQCAQTCERLLQELPQAEDAQHISATDIHSNLDQIRQVQDQIEAQIMSTVVCAIQLGHIEALVEAVDLLHWFDWQPEQHAIMRTYRFPDPMSHRSTPLTFGDCDSISVASYRRICAIVQNPLPLHNAPHIDFAAHVYTALYLQRWVEERTRINQLRLPPATPSL